MKIIFLDIDGVITSSRVGWYNFDIYAVHYLKWVCEVADAKIVISSSWRITNSREFFQTIFENHLHEDYDTPVIHTDVNRRGTEIQAWIDKQKDNNEAIEDFIILDDDLDMLPEHKMNHIITDSHNGLSFDNMTDIRTKFCINEYPIDSDKIYQHENMFGEGNPFTKSMTNFK